jgi:L-malate glycosyltransferase
VIRSVHQVMAGAGVGDAITNYAFEIRSIFRDLGFSSDLFAPLQNIPREYRQTEVKPVSRLSDQITAEDLLIYHYSIGSSATETYLNTPARKCLCYHNITPSKYFRFINARQAEMLAQGREELKNLISVTELSLADSNYNRQELLDMGFSKVEVVSLVVASDYLKTKPDPAVLCRFEDDKTNLLFVGRVAPNKRHEDLIKTFYYFKKTLAPSSRLILAGSYMGNEVYYTYLRSLVFDLDLTGSVFFTGHVRLEELVAYYRKAHAFICLSEHEGFCLPLIESMYFQVPVFALDRAAVSETMGESGVLIRENAPLRNAELIGYVLSHPHLKKEIVAAQSARLEHFNPSVLKHRLIQLVKEYFS